MVIRGGTVVNAAEISKCDVGVKDGRIVALGEKLDVGAEEIDAAPILDYGELNQEEARYPEYESWPFYCGVLDVHIANEQAVSCLL